MTGKTNTAGDLLLTLSTLWGASYSFIKIGVATIPPITLIAGAILVAIIRLRGLRLPRDQQAWKRFMFQACLNSVVPFFAERPLRPDAEAISDQKHPDQQLRIDGRAARVAVEIRQMGADATQINKPINRAQQVVLWDVILQREFVEQRGLRFLPRSQHCQPSPKLQELNQQFRLQSRKSFSTRYAEDDVRCGSAIETFASAANGRKVPHC